MDVDVARTCESLNDNAYHNKVEQLVGCNLGCEENNRIGYGKSLADSSSGYSDGDGDMEAYYVEDFVRYSEYEPENFLCERSVVEGGVVVKKPMNTYVYILKAEYRPKDSLELRNFCEKFLERAVVRFASEALRSVDKRGVFEALLTDAEHEKLSGMKEVSIAQQELFACLD